MSFASSAKKDSRKVLPRIRSSFVGHFYEICQAGIFANRNADGPFRGAVVSKQLSHSFSDVWATSQKRRQRVSQTRGRFRLGRRCLAPLLNVSKTFHFKIPIPCNAGYVLLDVKIKYIRFYTKICPTQRDASFALYDQPPAPMLTFNQEIIPVPPIGTPL